MKVIRRVPRAENYQAQGPYTDLALHTIGWKAFQDMAAQVCEERLKVRVTIHHEAKDGGQDAVFLIPSSMKKSPPSGTVQVKFSSDPKGSLKLADLTHELLKLRDLVKAGEAESYIVVTNMSVSATRAKLIRDTLREYGVNKPEVWGKQQIIQTIRESAKLRALVPQVYGLGDLTTILDVRAIEQTKAVLKAWLPKLVAYVPTNSHNRAVNVLDEFGIVLLLGNPASGKSTIGAILSAMAIEEEGHSVIQISSPEEFVKHWSIDHKNRFFWIDDAFGSNVVDTDYVQGWVRSFSKVSAALNAGNRFLFTSRNYIYRSAVTRLGSRNLPLFKTEAAIVNVGELSRDEKRQILYNHIKHGGQVEAWKEKAKRHLNAVAEVDGFLPGISERLANSDFTRKLQLTESALYDFMAKPQQHLIEVINELESEQFAALTLIYVHRGRLNVTELDLDAVSTVEEMTGCKATGILARLPELAGSFTRELSEAPDKIWGFEHPTISDAITAILDTQPNMTAAIVRGGPIEKVMDQFVCEHGPSTLNAAKIPTSLNGVLNRRLRDVPNNWRNNGILFEFLASRASDEIVRYQFCHHDGLISRMLFNSSRASNNARNRAAVRAYSLGALKDTDRFEISRELIVKAIDQLDLTWLEDDSFLALIEPRSLLSLGAALLSKISCNFDELLEGQRDGIDLDADIEDQYEVIISGLRIIETLVSDLDMLDREELFREAHERVRAEMNEILVEQEEHSAKQEDDGDWQVFSPSLPAPQPRDEKSDPGLRSIFVDVDGKR